MTFKTLRKERKKVTFLKRIIKKLTFIFDIFQVMIFKWNHITLSLLFSSYASLVDGHGYMYSPRSRNWVANEDGTDSWAGGGTVGTPKKEYCPHCLNSKAADEICGVGNAGNYDD